jgi:aromatic ring-opening dioxygenase catalytic subunit (LigB family)
MAEKSGRAQGIGARSPTRTSRCRQPSLYLTHGGGPCFWVEFPTLGPHAYDGLRAYLAGLLSTLPESPRAILIVSAHWEESIPTVCTAVAPTMLFDYYNFPPHTYQLKYAAPGAPEVALQARDLLAAAGIPVNTDEDRSYDHGVFVPMLIIDPEARIPVAMLSMRGDLDPSHHLAIGAALEPLRDEGILIIGSGSSYHNLSVFMDGKDNGSAAFDAWLHDTVTQADPTMRRARLASWESAPSARESHPKPDHLIPLMVAAGAAGNDRGHRTFVDLIDGKLYSCFSFSHD